MDKRIKEENMTKAQLVKELEVLRQQISGLESADISRKQAEEVAVGLGLILESSLNEIYIFDAESFRFVHLNRGAVTNIRYSLEELREMTPADIKPEFTLSQFEELITPLHTGEQDKVEFITHHERKDGSTYPVEVHLQLSSFASNPAFVAIILDITERQRTAEELKKYQEHLEELISERTIELEEANKNLYVLSQLKDEFISNVSHELRSPVTSIKLHHELLSQKPDRLPRYLPTLVRETQRLANIVEGLLALTRLDQHRVAFNPNPIDLNSLVISYVTDRTLVAKTKGLSLHYEIAEDLPPAKGDIKLIGQVLSGLLTNAINYTQNGGEITVHTGVVEGEDRQWACFSITDNGYGIPKSEQSRLFGRFFRGEVAVKSGVSGTGLGLAIIKEIVDRHEGRIVIESTGVSGEGTTASVWLPI